MASSEIASQVARYESNLQSYFLASIPIDCWRHRQGQTVADKVVLDIESWNHKCDRYVYGDSEIEGNARVTINPANPFWILVDEKSVSGGEEYNLRVAENIEALGGLLLTLVDMCKPQRLKLFVDQSWNFPHNAHCAYFDNVESVIKDIRLLERIWKEGSLYENLPLNESALAADEMCFSALRSVGQRHKLWNTCNEMLHRPTPLTPDDVRTALESTSCNIDHVSGDGFFVFENEFFLNSFVDEFYLDVLKAAQGNHNGT